MGSVTDAISDDAAGSDYLLKDSTTGNSADFVLPGGPTWIFLDVQQAPNSSARVLIEMPTNCIVRAFRASNQIIVKLRTQFTPTNGTEATGDYATLQGGATDISNLIFAVTDGQTVRLYTRT